MSKWGAYCNAHKIRDRRHGHPEQEAVTKALLAPYIKIVRERMKKNQDSELWGLLIQRWEDALADCRRYLSDAVDRGVPYVVYRRDACNELVKLAQHVQPKEIMETALAVFILGEWERRRFKSDRGFWFQLVRRVRGLSDVNAGAYYDHLTGKTKRVYRDPAPRAVAAMAEIIADTFGAAGVTIARKASEEIEVRIGLKRRTLEALGALA